MLIPSKLQKGDEIRVVSPSTSLAVLTPEVHQGALTTWERLGFKVTFGKNAKENDLFSSSSIESRVEDLHQAFADADVKCVLTTLGGYNCNQLLRYLDFDLIRSNPKVFCGYSDITALGTAIYAKTGLVTYSGPHFSTFGMQQGLEYTLQHFTECLMQPDSFDVAPAGKWSDDPWYRDQQNRIFKQNPGYLVIHQGQAEGFLLGGNLCTLNLLQGTEYMPSLSGAILLLEDDEESHPLTFDRDLQSLIHQPGFGEVRGLVIGRFQRASRMSSEKLVQIIRSKKELERLPIVANADFGHTTPQFTFPIGGTGRLSVEKGRVRLSIVRH